MKKYKYLLLVVVLGSLACKRSVLDENLTTARAMSYYATDAGIASLATGTYYAVFSLPFNGEWMYSNTNYGTDEFHVGGDNSNAQNNAYSNGLASIITPINGNTITSSAQWDSLYLGIGDANLIIQNANASASTSPAVKKTALGEGHFFRAYNYLRLVSQYGAVPLKTKVSTTIELEFTRAAPKDVYAQIISDFDSAYILLSNGTGPAHITKDAAAHFLAKAYLYRASEINDSWNSSTKAADLAAIGPLCDEVIANHPLATDFASLWHYTVPDGPNEKLPEIILAAQFTADASTKGTNTHAA
jgi:hypothetical protein